MNSLRLLLAIILLSPALARAEDAALPKEYVRFDGQVLALASQGENANEHVKEYIPEGEKLNSWTRLAAFHEYPKLDDPMPVVANLVEILKQQNPGAKSRVIKNPKTGEVIVDFVTWMDDDSFVEFNVFRYSKKPGGGLVAQQYAVRDYKDIRAFLKALGPLRQRLVDEMAQDGLVMGK